MTVGTNIPTNSSSGAAHDPTGPTTELPPHSQEDQGRGRTKKTLDDLDLKPHRIFGYWFDFGDDWYHQVQVERIDTPSRPSPIRV